MSNIVDNIITRASKGEPLSATDYDTVITRLANAIGNISSGHSHDGVDSKSLSGSIFNIVEPARAATTVAITLSDIQNIDGIDVLAGDRVLVKNQLDKADNGVYNVIASAAWTRAVDADAWTDYINMMILVSEGTDNHATSFYCNATPDGTLETDGMDFLKTSGATTSMTLTNGVIQTAETGSRVVMTSNGIYVYDATEQRAKIGSDGSGWLGAADKFYWDNAGNVIFAGFGLGVASDGLGSSSGGNTTNLSGGGTFAFLAGPTGTPTFTVTHSGILTAAAGTIGGWAMGETILQSAAAGSARIVLDQGLARITVKDASDTSKVVMGYLDNLPKHDGTGYWSVGDYGFWAAAGDHLKIDGDATYKSGDWIVENDGAYLIQNAADQTIVRLGTVNAIKGLYIYDTATPTQNLIAKFATDGLYLGAPGGTANCLSYTLAGGMVLKGEISILNPGDINTTDLNNDAGWTDDSALTTFVDDVYAGDLATLQSQLDGSITTWFDIVAPTLENTPAVNWNTTQLKDDHLGDIYYDTVTGLAYRFQVLSAVYSWAELSDSGVAAALAAAATAQDTADGKRRVFTATPTVPYDVGDLWLTSLTDLTGDLKKCITAAATGAYNAAHWVVATKYTDDTTANAAASTANTAIGILDDIASDTKITPGEKLTAKQLWDAIVAEGTPTSGTLPVAATAAGVADTAFDTDYATLNTYLNTTLTVFANMTTTTTITRSAWDTAWKNYYDERTKLINAITTAARSVANSAASAASGAQSTANTAISTLNDIASDTKITPVDKLRAKQLWDAIVVEGTATTGTIPVAAIALSVDHANFDTDYAALNTYLNTTLTVFSNMTTTTTIVRTTWDTTWKNYYDERTKLLNAIAAKAATVSTWAGVAGAGKPANNATVGATWTTDVYSRPGFLVYESDASPSGLYISSTRLGYWNTDSNSWMSYMNNAGQFYLTGTSGGLSWDGSTLLVTGDYKSHPNVGVGSNNAYHQGFHIATSTNEFYFYGDITGNGTSIALCASIGIKTYGADKVIGYFGGTTSNHIALIGEAYGKTAIQGLSNLGVGIFGYSVSNYGVWGRSSGASAAIYGLTAISGVYAIEGYNSHASVGIGVYGHSTQHGVYGITTGATGDYGVIGQATAALGSGVYGVATTGNGIHGESTSGYAGYFVGNVYITGNCSFLSFTDRTPFYEGDALSEIQKIKSKDGKIDHSTLPTFATRIIKKDLMEDIEDIVPDPDWQPDDKSSPRKTVIRQVKVGETEEIGRDLGAMISMFTIAFQQIATRLEALEKKK